MEKNLADLQSQYDIKKLRISSLEKYNIPYEAAIKYFLYVGALHGLLLALTIMLLRDKLWWFLATELSILISLYVAWRMFRAFIVPVQLMASGAESLKQKDFSVQFNRVGQRELDALIEVYNQMIEQLRLERTQLTEQHYLLQK